MDGDVNIFKKLTVYNMDVAKLWYMYTWGNPNDLNYMSLFVFSPGQRDASYSSKSCISDPVSNCHTLYSA